jgi:hypothetical protein
MINETAGDRMVMYVKHQLREAEEELRKAKVRVETLQSTLSSLETINANHLKVPLS